VFEPSALGRGAGLAAASVRASFRREKPDQESVAVLSNGYLYVRLGGDSQETLSDRDRLLGRIEPNLEYLLRSLELPDQPFELTLLLFALTSRRTQLARLLASFVH
jgi:hypothetical protein